MQQPLYEFTLQIYVNYCHKSPVMREMMILYYLTKQGTKNKPQQSITDKKKET